MDRRQSTYLGFAIGPQPRAGAVFPHFSQPVAQLRSQQMGEGHQLGRFIRGVAEHMSLVTYTVSSWALT